MPLNLDRYLMLLLRQFHLEHVQSLAEALTTVIAGRREEERERERHSGVTEKGSDWLNERWWDGHKNKGTQWKCG